MLCFRLFSENNPAVPLADAVAQLRDGHAPKDLYAVAPASFQQIPNAPFAYWVSERIRRLFVELPAFDANGRQARLGASTKNDFRFLRICWELSNDADERSEWTYHVKGGPYSPFYADVNLVIKWVDNAREIEAELLRKYPYLGTNAEFVLHRDYPHLRQGLTWPRRTTSSLSMRALPAGCVFADKGPAAFSDLGNDDLLYLLGICQSSTYQALLALQLAAADAAARSYEVGLIQRTVLPFSSASDSKRVGSLSFGGWVAKRRMDSTNLTSHAFHKPAFSPSALMKKTI
jgi:hypothetical protein